MEFNHLEDAISIHESEFARGMDREKLTKEQQAILSDIPASVEREKPMLSGAMGKVLGKDGHRAVIFPATLSWC